jgi:hypothetical protein
MSFFKTISPALILGLAVATGANAQAFGVVETGGAFGVGTGAVPVAVAPAPRAFWSRANHHDNAPTLIDNKKPALKRF